MKYNTTIHYAASFDLAARAIANHSRGEDPRVQSKICEQYGIFLDKITDTELDYLNALLEKYSR